MNQRLWPLALALSSIMLTGCSHTLFFASRTSGASGQTVVQTKPGSSGGDIRLAMGSRNYVGRWVYMSSGGSLTLASATAFSGTRSVSALGTGVAVPMAGNGSIIMNAAEGGSLHCVFNYSRFSSSGVGECQDEAGGSYDLQISK